MSTKQPAVAVISRSNRGGPLSRLHPPLVGSRPSGVPFGKLFEEVSQV